MQKQPLIQLGKYALCAAISIGLFCWAFGVPWKVNNVTRHYHEVTVTHKGSINHNGSVTLLKL